MKRAKIGFLFTLLCGVASSPALARSSYFETGFGATRIDNAAPFFTAATPGASSTSFGYDIGLFYNLWGRVAQLQVGLQNRSASGSSAGGTYSLDIPYGSLRVQLSRFYFGGGFAPIVAMKSSNTAGNSGYYKAPSTTAMFVEAGLLWPVTPLFSLGTFGGMQLLNTTAATNPRVLDFGVLLRFYFGNTGSEGGSSNEFKGWRYPFGREL